MKLIRFGEPHGERPGMIGEDGKRYDLSAFGEDYDEAFFATDGIDGLGQASQRVVAWDGL